MRFRADIYDKEFPRKEAPAPVESMVDNFHDEESIEGNVNDNVEQVSDVNSSDSDGLVNQTEEV